jgi:Tol biopolymer transport system component
MVAAVALCAAPSASADIIAAVDVPLAAGAGSSVTQHPDQFDVALLNATTGARFSLPAGVNTATADEFHPSLTPDGKWLAFERVDPSAGTTRIIATNLTTGQVADLFNTFDVSTMQPATPFVEPGGSAVVTGTPYSFKPQWTSTR